VEPVAKVGQLGLKTGSHFMGQFASTKKTPRTCAIDISPDNTNTVVIITMIMTIFYYHYNDSECITVLVQDTSNQHC